jgi:hypothetical protein
MIYHDEGNTTTRGRIEIANLVWGVVRFEKKMKKRKKRREKCLLFSGVAHIFIPGFEKSVTTIPQRRQFLRFGTS